MDGISENSTMKNRNGAVLATLLIVISVFVLSGGGVFLWQKNILQEKEVSYSEDIARVERKVVTLKEEKDEIQDDYETAISKYRVLETKSNKFEWDYLQIQEQYEAVTKDIQSLKASKKSFEVEKNKFQTEIETLKKAAKENDTKQKELEEQIDLLKKKVEELTKNAHQKAQKEKLIKEVKKVVEEKKSVVTKEVATEVKKSETTKTQVVKSPKEESSDVLQK